MSEQTNPTLDSILQKRRRRTILRVVGAGAALAIGGLLYWLYGRGEHAEPPPPPEPASAEVVPGPAPVVAPAAESAPVAESESAADARPLPPLPASDAFVREGVARLSSRPEWVAWLASEELIRRFVAAVDSVAQGESPVEQAPAAMRLQGRFEVAPSGAIEVASPSSFARYGGLTEVLVGVDTQGLVQARRELGPLLEEAYHDLGHPNRTFDAALRDAIFRLLSTPTVVGEPPLERLTLGFGYVDPALEDLSAAQKQLLRFGPENAARIQQKVREVAVALGIPESELPRTPRYEVSAAR